MLFNKRVRKQKKNKLIALCTRVLSLILITICTKIAVFLPVITVNTICGLTQILRKTKLSVIISGSRLLFPHKVNSRLLYNLLKSRGYVYYTCIIAYFTLSSARSIVNSFSAIVQCFHQNQSYVRDKRLISVRFVFFSFMLYCYCWAFAKIRPRTTGAINLHNSISHVEKKRVK